MIKKLTLAAVIAVISFSSTAASQKEMLTTALAGDYATQRNLAYSYMNGWGTEGTATYIPKDPVRGCAWRKIILLTNYSKADAGDAGNESVDCGKVHPADNQKVWEMVHTIIKLMASR